MYVCSDEDLFAPQKASEQFWDEENPNFSPYQGDLEVHVIVTVT